MDFYKRKIIKKLKYHGLVITIISIIIAVTNCSKKESLEPSLETALENYNENTLLDEIIDLSNNKSETGNNIPKDLIEKIIKPEACEIPELKQEHYYKRNTTSQENMNVQKKKKR